MRRRSFEAFGFVTGSNRAGSRGIPARSAASGSVSLLAGFWKYVSAAWPMPYAPFPK